MNKARTHRLRQGVASLTSLGLMLLSACGPPGLERTVEDCSEVISCEHRLGAGLAWSKLQYREQYAESNWSASVMSGMDDPANERFLDVGGRAYSREFLARFSYADPVHTVVRVAYLRRAETFIGKLTAKGLKPNFAYQMKLRGVYADKPAFERIGYLGRWRQPETGAHLDDASYRESRRKQEVESYLLFDYFVTDENGAATREFYADSSLHVLWNATTQRPPAELDSAVRAVVLRDNGSGVYVTPRPQPSVMGLYAETEERSRPVDRRPRIGRAFLPAGTYSVEMVLIEESFHGYGDGGNWAAVMRAPVTFDIVERPPPPPPGLGELATVVDFGADVEWIRGIEEAVRTPIAFEGQATNADPMIGYRSRFELLPGARYFLVAEVLTGGDHDWEVYLTDARDWATIVGSRKVTSTDCRGWRRFVVEITGCAGAGAMALRLDPAVRPGPVGMRAVRISRLVE